MNGLMVYDSVFGNTERIAQVAAEALAFARALRVSEAEPEQLKGFGLVVVGSPTQGFRPTVAMREWLGRIPAGTLTGVRVAAFDTRLAASEAPSKVLSFFMKLAGPGAYAAKHIADALERGGGSLIAPPEGFFVTGTEGPLKDGELARATAWARQLSQLERTSRVPAAAGAQG